MRRYLLFMLMALLPCLGLGAWGTAVHLREGRRDEANLRYGYRELAEDGARKALDAILGRLAARAADGVEALASQAEVAVALVAEPATAQAAAAAPTVSGGADPRLLAAHRCEFVDHDLPGAERAYRALLAPGVAPELVAEAQAGLVGTLTKLGRTEAAVAALSEGIASGALPWEVAAALALACAEAGEPAPGLAQALVRLWWSGREQPNQTLAARLQAEIERRRGVFPPDLAADYDRRAAQAGREARWRLMLFQLEPQARAWVDRRPASGWCGLADGAVLAAFPGPSAGQPLLCRLDPAALRRSVEAVLPGQPGLAAVAQAYRDRHGRAIDEALGALSVATPWGRRLEVSTPATPPAIHSRWPADLTLPLLIAVALASTGTGLVFLYRTARRDLESMQRRADFVSNVTHELKTPLSLVKMFGEMLSLGYARDEAERRTWYGIIVQETARLSQLIANVLDFAALDKGVRRQASEPVELAALVQAVLDTYRAQLDRDGFALALELSPVIVSGDRGALTQVLINLLGNAMTYSTDRKALAVAVRRDGAEAVLTVSDQGIGIAAEHLERIFEPFFRVETGLSRETRGAGIGLSLVRSIVLAHRGRVDVASTPGAGSTFTVRLPAAP